MATGSSLEWWLPTVAGEPLPEEGPLPFWLGALFVGAFGRWLGAIDAARLVCVVWFAIGTSALWYATYRLARRDEAQPVALAFGGEASPRDYGRMLADIAVLLLLATFGVIARLHETSAESALLALSCVVMFGLAYSLDNPWTGAAATGIALGAIALTRGWLPAAALGAAALVFTLSYGQAPSGTGCLDCAAAAHRVCAVADRGTSCSSAGSGVVLHPMVAMEPQRSRAARRRPL